MSPPNAARHRKPIPGPPAEWFGGVITGAACLWLLVWLRFAFTLPLANNIQFDRLELIFIFPDASTLFFTPEHLPTGWRYFPERFDLIAVAFFICIGAWAWGRLLRRATRLECDDWLEQLAISYGLGLLVWSLITLLLGLIGWLNQGIFAGLLILPMIAEASLIFRDRYRLRRAKTSFVDHPPRWLRNVCLAIAALFISRALLGSMLPPMAFDVREYHLGGPKEWFLDGRVHFLPHNVYTSFPFLTEMLSLSAMVLRDDWFRGALAGKLLLATFYPLTALAIFVTGRRLFGATAGLLGMLLYATTPWSYRIATIAYAEGGLTCYLILALLSCARALDRSSSSPRAWIFITGLFAGAAMACKYTGVVQVVIPLGLALLAGTIINTVRPRNQEEPSLTTPWRRISIVGMIYTAGVFIAVGPWLLKNLVETGNPVYPLVWTIFGGVDWNAELNKKWLNAHHASDYSLGSFFAGLKSIAITNDWQSVLIFPLIPLAALSRNRRQAGYIGLFLIWLLIAWWGLTHRIDRFWVPLLPVACLLAGVGMAWPRAFSIRDCPEPGQGARQSWRWICGIATGGVIAFNYLLITSPLIGNPHVLTKLDAASRAVENPNLAALNKVLPPDAKLLLVGEADIFDARFPVVYNTVFDKNLFEQWTAIPGTQQLKPVAEIRGKLQAEGVTHLFVNWKEILRYRTTYGYTEFVTPERFQTLQQLGILKDPATIRVIPLELLNESEQQAATTHFPSLLHGQGNRRSIIIGQLYKVGRNELNHRDTKGAASHRDRR